MTNQEYIKTENPPIFFQLIRGGFSLTPMDQQILWEGEFRPMFHLHLGFKDPQCTERSTYQDKNANEFFNQQPFELDKHTILVPWTCGYVALETASTPSQLENYDA